VVHTRWFDFTVNSLKTATSYAGYTAASGNTLIIANITIKNTYTDSPTTPFGTYDWTASDDTLTYWIDAMSPLDSTMMPDDYELTPNQTATYNVVFEVSSSLPDPYIAYVEVGGSGTVYDTYIVYVKN